MDVAGAVDFRFEAGSVSQTSIVNFTDDVVSSSQAAHDLIQTSEEVKISEHLDDNEASGVNNVPEDNTKTVISEASSSTGSQEDDGPTSVSATPGLSPLNPAAGCQISDVTIKPDDTNLIDLNSSWLESSSGNDRQIVSGVKPAEDLDLLNITLSSHHPAESFNVLKPISSHSDLNRTTCASNDSLNTVEARTKPELHEKGLKLQEEECEASDLISFETVTESKSETNQLEADFSVNGGSNTVPLITDTSEVKDGNARNENMEDQLMDMVKEKDNFELCEDGDKGETVDELVLELSQEVSGDNCGSTLDKSHFKVGHVSVSASPVEFNPSANISQKVNDLPRALCEQSADCFPKANEPLLVTSEPEIDVDVQLRQNNGNEQSYRSDPPLVPAALTYSGESETSANEVTADGSSAREQNSGKEEPDENSMLSEESNGDLDGAIMGGAVISNNDHVTSEQSKGDRPKGEAQELPDSEKFMSYKQQSEEDLLFEETGSDHGSETEEPPVATSHVEASSCSKDDCAEVQVDKKSDMSEEGDEANSLKDCDNDGELTERPVSLNNVQVEASKDDCTYGEVQGLVNEESPLLPQHQNETEDGANLFEDDGDIGESTELVTSPNTCQVEISKDNFVEAEVDNESHLLPEQQNEDEANSLEDGSNDGELLETTATPYSADSCTPKELNEDIIAVKVMQNKESHLLSEQQIEEDEVNLLRGSDGDVKPIEQAVTPSSFYCARTDLNDDHIAEEVMTNKKSHLLSEQQVEEDEANLLKDDEPDFKPFERAFNPYSSVACTSKVLKEGQILSDQRIEEDEANLLKDDDDDVKLMVTPNGAFFCAPKAINEDRMAVKITAYNGSCPSEQCDEVDVLAETGCGDDAKVMRRAVSPKSFGVPESFYKDHNELVLSEQLVEEEAKLLGETGCDDEVIEQLVEDSLLADNDDVSNSVDDKNKSVIAENVQVDDDGKKNLPVNVEGTKVTLDKTEAMEDISDDHEDCLLSDSIEEKTVKLDCTVNNDAQKLFDGTCEDNDSNEFKFCHIDVEKDMTCKEIYGDSKSNTLSVCLDVLEQVIEVAMSNVDDLSDYPKDTSHFTTNSIDNVGKTDDCNNSTYDIVTEIILELIDSVSAADIDSNLSSTQRLLGKQLYDRESDEPTNNSTYYIVTEIISELINTVSAADIDSNLSSPPPLLGKQLCDREYDEPTNNSTYYIVTEILSELIDSVSAAADNKNFSSPQSLLPMQVCDLESEEEDEKHCIFKVVGNIRKAEECLNKGISPKLEIVKCDENILMDVGSEEVDPEDSLEKDSILKVVENMRKADECLTEGLSPKTQILQCENQYQMDVSCEKDDVESTVAKVERNLKVVEESLSNGVSPKLINNSEPVIMGQDSKIKEIKNEASLDVLDEKVSKLFLPDSGLSINDVKVEDENLSVGPSSNTGSGITTCETFPTEIDGLDKQSLVKAELPDSLTIKDGNEEKSRADEPIASECESTEGVLGTCNDTTSIGDENSKIIKTSSDIVPKEIYSSDGKIRDINDKVTCIEKSEIGTINNEDFPVKTITQVFSTDSSDHVLISPETIDLKNDTSSEKCEAVRSDAEEFKRESIAQLCTSDGKHVNTNDSFCPKNETFYEKPCVSESIAREESEEQKISTPCKADFNDIIMDLVDEIVNRSGTLFEKSEISEGSVNKQPESKLFDKEVPIVADEIFQTKLSEKGIIDDNGRIVELNDNASVIHNTEDKSLIFNGETEIPAQGDVKELCEKDHLSQNEVKEAVNIVETALKCSEQSPESSEWVQTKSDSNKDCKSEVTDKNREEKECVAGKAEEIQQKVSSTISPSDKTESPEFLAVKENPDDSALVTTEELNQDQLEIGVGETAVRGSDDATCLLNDPVSTSKTESDDVISSLQLSSATNITDREEVPDPSQLPATASPKEKSVVGTKITDIVEPSGELKVSSCMPESDAELSEVLISKQTVDDVEERVMTENDLLEENLNNATEKDISAVEEEMLLQDDFEQHCQDGGDQSALEVCMQMVNSIVERAVTLCTPVSWGVQEDPSEKSVTSSDGELKSVLEVNKTVEATLVSKDVCSEAAVSKVNEELQLQNYPNESGQIVNSDVSDVATSSDTDITSVLEKRTAMLVSSNVSGEMAVSTTNEEMLLQCYPDESGNKAGNVKIPLQNASSTTTSVSNTCDATSDGPVLPNDSDVSKQIVDEIVSKGDEEMEEDQLLADVLNDGPEDTNEDDLLKDDDVGNDASVSLFSEDRSLTCTNTDKTIEKQNSIEESMIIDTEDKVQDVYGMCRTIVDDILDFIGEDELSTDDDDYSPTDDVYESAMDPEEEEEEEEGENACEENGNLVAIEILDDLIVKVLRQCDSEIIASEIVEEIVLKSSKSEEAMMIANDVMMEIIKSVVPDIAIVESTTIDSAKFEDMPLSQLIKTEWIDMSYHIKEEPAEYCEEIEEAAKPKKRGRPKNRTNSSSPPKKIKTEKVDKRIITPTMPKMVWVEKKKKPTSVKKKTKTPTPSPKATPRKSVASARKTITPPPKKSQTPTAKKAPASTTRRVSAPAVATRGRQSDRFKSPAVALSPRVGRTPVPPSRSSAERASPTARRESPLLTRRQSSATPPPPVSPSRGTKRKSDVPSVVPHKKFPVDSPLRNVAVKSTGGIREVKMKQTARKSTMAFPPRPPPSPEPIARPSRGRPPNSKKRPFTSPEPPRPNKRQAVGISIRRCHVNIERMAFIEHLVAKKKPVNEPNICELCEPKRVFMTKDSLVKHLKEEHCNTLGSANLPQVDRCAGCDRKYFSKTRLAEHMRTCPAVAALGAPSKLSPAAEKKSTDNWNFQCLVCPRLFMLKSALDSHMKSHEVDSDPLNLDIAGPSTRRGAEPPKPLAKPTVPSQAIAKTTAPPRTGAGGTELPPTFASTMMRRSGKLVMKLKRQSYKCTTCRAVFTNQVQLAQHNLIHAVRIKEERKSPEIEIIAEMLVPRTSKSSAATAPTVTASTVSPPSVNPPTATPPVLKATARKSTGGAPSIVRRPGPLQKTRVLPPLPRITRRNPNM